MSFTATFYTVSSVFSYCQITVAWVEVGDSAENEYDTMKFDSVVIRFGRFVLRVSVTATAADELVA